MNSAGMTAGQGEDSKVKEAVKGVTVRVKPRGPPSSRLELLMPAHSRAVDLSVLTVFDRSDFNSMLVLSSTSPKSGSMRSAASTCCVKKARA